MTTVFDIKINSFLYLSDIRTRDSVSVYLINIDMRKTNLFLEQIPHTRDTMMKRKRSHRKEIILIDNRFDRIINLNKFVLISHIGTEHIEHGLV